MSTKPSGAITLIIKTASILRPFGSKLSESFAFFWPDLATTSRIAGLFDKLFPSCQPVPSLLIYMEYRHEKAKENTADNTQHSDLKERFVSSKNKVHKDAPKTTPEQS